MFVTADKKSYSAGKRILVYVLAQQFIIIRCVYNKYCNQPQDMKGLILYYSMHTVLFELYKLLDGTTSQEAIVVVPTLSLQKGRLSDCTTEGVLALILNSAQGKPLTFLAGQ